MGKKIPLLLTDLSLQFFRPVQVKFIRILPHRASSFVLINSERLFPGYYVRVDAFITKYSERLAQNSARTYFFNKKLFN